MRYYPEDESEFNDIKEMKAEEYQLECLKLNPDYCCWGNYEDYMNNESNDWVSPVEIDSINDLWVLDDYNELVNFYFEVSRECKTCPKCDGDVYNKDTQQLKVDWYDFDRTGSKWYSKLTQDEVDALWEAEKLQTYFKEKPTAESVNEMSRENRIHDSGSMYICLEVRAKRLGIYGYCDECDGKGYLYTEEKASLKLQMWFIHPRKGAGRGVLLKNIKEDEVPIVVEYLKSARDRNYNRFSKL